MAPTSASPLESPNDCCLSRKHFKINKGVSFIYGLEHLSNCCFCAVSQDKQICVHFKSGFSILYSPMVLLEVSPAGFQGQRLWGLVHLVQFPRLRVPDVRGTNPVLLRDNLHIMNSFLTVGPCAQGRISNKTVSPRLLPVSMWPFYPLLQRCCLTRFQVLFRGICSTCSCRTVVFMGVGGFSSFYGATLTPRHLFFLLIFQLFVCQTFTLYSTIFNFFYLFCILFFPPLCFSQTIGSIELSVNVLLLSSAQHIDQITNLRYCIVLFCNFHLIIFINFTSLVKLSMFLPIAIQFLYFLEHITVAILKSFVLKCQFPDHL